MWTVDVYGSEVIGAQQVADAVLAQVRPGSVVLMHNGKLSTLQALPTIIKELRARGYAFATVDALARRLAASREAARQTAVAYARTRHAESGRAGQRVKESKSKYFRAAERQKAGEHQAGSESTNAPLNSPRVVGP